MASKLDRSARGIAIGLASSVYEIKAIAEKSTIYEVRGAIDIEGAPTIISALTFSYFTVCHLSFHIFFLSFHISHFVSLLSFDISHLKVYICTPIIYSGKAYHTSFNSIKNK